MIFFLLFKIPYVIYSLKMANLSFFMVFIIFGGKSSVAIYNTIICLTYIHYRNY